jgi:hypothetical protein
MVHGKVRGEHSIVRATRSWIHRKPVVVDRLVYTTITLMSVLIIYDGWQNLRAIDVVGIIVGPILAMFIAHIFSGILAQ